jgi:hypothetical protein
VHVSLHVMSINTVKPFLLLSVNLAMLRLPPLLHTRLLFLHMRASCFYSRTN